MSEHKEHPHKNHHHDHKDHGTAHDRASNKKMIHHDWRFWIALVLMLLAIVAYVLSLDESVRPGGGEQPEVPAMAE